MTSLIPESPLAGTGARHGDCQLAEAALAPLHWIAPYPGKEAALSELMKATHGLSFPAPGETEINGGAEIRWAGRAQALLIGRDDPLPDAAGVAAVTDVSDVYIRMVLSGEATPDVLARLVPIDLRKGAFPPGRTAKSLLGHISAQFTAVEGGVEIMVMRSFALTAYHEIDTAMVRVAARMMLY